MAEFSERRQAEAKTAGVWDSTAVNAADDEIAAALTMTSRSTQLLIDRAAALQRLPATAQALTAGKIDMPKALVFINGLAGQDPGLARAIEARLIEGAPALTTGQLRAALNRDLLAADPEAAERRRQTEEKQARVERCPEQGGVTASLSGRNLPVPATVAAWNHVTAVARGLRRSGASGTLDELRVLVYLGLLSGQAASDLAAVPVGTEGGATPGETDVDDCSGPGPATTSGDRAGGTGTQGARGSSTAPGTQRAGGSGTQGAGAADTEGDGPGAADRGGAAGAEPEAGTEPTTRARQQEKAGGGNLIGSVNLTVPLTTLLGLGQSPGELTGFGPITAFAARDLAARALDAPAVRWCVTVTGENGEPIGHGCAPPSRPAHNAMVGAFSLRISALAGTDCAHERESSHYRPPPGLWHLIQIRNPRCTAPGCRMPAAKCDDDHTRAVRPGRTHLRVQLRAAVPLSPSSEAVPGLATRAARARNLCLGYAVRADLHYRPWQVRRLAHPVAQLRAAHTSRPTTADRARRAGAGRSPGRQRRLTTTAPAERACSSQPRTTMCCAFWA